MQGLTPTPRTTLKRRPERGSYDWATVARILDDGLVCHLGFALEGQPYVIPTAYVRVDDRLYIHGSAASRTLCALERGVAVCVTVTSVEGLVLARSAFHHSMNYRSVLVFGVAAPVLDPAEKVGALRALIEHVVPGRWDEVRGPNAKELKATLVLALALTEASAKVRSGPPLDDQEDYAHTVWAGEIPLQLAVGAPIGDPRLLPGVAPPRYVVEYRTPATRARPDR